MQLLMSPASPFARKCRVAIRELGLTGAVAEQEVTTTAMASDPTVVAANPSGKIPALLRSDAATLYDSRVITRFLNDHAGGTLYPTTAPWEVLTLEATADAIMESAVLMTYEVRLRPEKEQSPAWIAAQWDKIDRTVTALDARWMGHLAGPLHIGQIAAACALSYLDLRHDARGWRNDRPALAQWHADFGQRDSMQATQPT